MPDPDETSGLSDFRAALEAHGGGMRSPLFQWMYRNHDALLEMFSEVRPNWPQVTAVLTERASPAPMAGRSGPNGTQAVAPGPAATREGTGRHETKARHKCASRNECAGRAGGTGGSGTGQRR